MEQLVFMNVSCATGFSLLITTTWVFNKPWRVFSAVVFWILLTASVWYVLGWAAIKDLFLGQLIWFLAPWLRMAMMLAWAPYFVLDIVVVNCLSLVLASLVNLLSCTLLKFAESYAKIPLHISLYVAKLQFALLSCLDVLGWVASIDLILGKLVLAPYFPYCGWLWCSPELSRARHCCHGLRT